MPQRRDARSSDLWRLRRAPASSGTTHAGWSQRAGCESHEPAVSGSRM